MTKSIEKPAKQAKIWQLPRNVWVVGLTSFFMDISSEMVINILPLFLSNVLGVQTSIIGLIEGFAEATASILKLFSGWLSDKFGGRKWLAVAGYGISAVSKPFFYYANTWGLIAGVRWADRVGKGIRTAPRDALVANSVTKETRGLAFGFHRAMDTAGAMVGIAIAVLVVWLAQRNTLDLSKSTFQSVVLISLIPGFLAVISLTVGVKDVPVKGKRIAPKFSLKGMGKPFIAFLVIAGIFTLGNSSDAFLIFARAKSWHIRHWNSRHACDVQSDLLADINPCRLTFRSDRSSALDHQRLVGVCCHLLGVCFCAKSMAGLVPLCCIRDLLWLGLRNRKCAGCRPCPRSFAWFSLWDLQRNYWFFGIPSLVHCWNTLARRWDLERIWGLSTLFIWWNISLDCISLDDFLAAKDLKR